MPTNQESENAYHAWGGFVVGVVVSIIIASMAGALYRVAYDTGVEAQKEEARNEKR